MVTPRPRSTVGKQRVGIQIAEALAYAHAQGVIHRDIKPSNLLLDEHGTVWVTDFGLAHDNSDTLSLTHTGDLLGTLRYLAPERLTARGDERSDIYGLGVTLYELVCGRPAYAEADRAMLLHQLMHLDPPRLRKLNGRVSSDLETIIHKAIERAPKERYASAAALALDLHRFLAGEPIAARRVLFWERAWKWAKRSPAVAALLVVLHVAAAALLITFVISYIQIDRALALANDEKLKAQSARNQERVARERADEARASALAETYRASLGEVRALRAGHLPGWRDLALGSVARLAKMPTPRRDLFELRTEAVAALGGFDIVEVAEFIGMSNTPETLAFSPDSRFLAAAATNRRLYLWENRGSPSQWSLVEEDDNRGQPGMIKVAPARPSVAFLAEGSLAYTTADSRITFYDSRGRPSRRRPLEAGPGPESRLATDRLGRFIAVGRGSGQIDLYDVATGALCRSLSAQPTAIALSPDGEQLAAIGPHGSVELHRTNSSGAPISLVQIRGKVSCLAFSPDGSVLGACVDGQGTAILCDVAGRKEPITLRGHKNNLHALAFSPDGEWVATTSFDHTARVWDARTAQMLAILRGRWIALSVAFSPDGELLAVSHGMGSEQVRLYHIRGRREQKRLAGHRYGATSLAIHPRQPVLASGADDGDIIIWDSETWRPRQRWHSAESRVSTLAFSPDGALLASGNGTASNHARSDSPIMLWDTATQMRRQVLYGQRNGVWSVTFDASGQRVASIGMDGNLFVWDAVSGRVLRRESIGSQEGMSVAFIGDGRHVAASVADQLAIVDLEGKEPARRVVLPHGWGRFVVDPRRGCLVVGGSDGELSSLSLPDLTLGRHLAKAHEGIVWSLAFSGDGRMLATGGADRRVVLRDPETFEPWLEFPEWTGVVKSLAFDPSGTKLAVAGTDADVAVWDLERIHDGLLNLRLAWDQPPPAVDPESAGSGENKARPTVAVITPATTDPLGVGTASSLIESGIKAIEDGRRTDAIRILREVCPRLRALVLTNPGADSLARWLAVGLISLGSALRSEDRVADADAVIREARQVVEGMRHPAWTDLYNLARAYALASLSPPTPEEREQAANRAIDFLGRTVKAGMNDDALIDRDHDLDPLRMRRISARLCSTEAFLLIRSPARLSRKPAHRGPTRASRPRRTSRRSARSARPRHRRLKRSIAPSSRLRT